MVTIKKRKIIILITITILLLSFVIYKTVNRSMIKCVINTNDIQIYDEMQNASENTQEYDTDSSDIEYTMKCFNMTMNQAKDFLMNQDKYVICRLNGTINNHSLFRLGNVTGVGNISDTQIWFDNTSVCEGYLEIDPGEVYDTTLRFIVKKSMSHEQIADALKSKRFYIRFTQNKLIYQKIKWAVKEV